MIKILSLILVCFSSILGAYSQDKGLIEFYSSSYVPKELNIRSSDRIDSIYSNYLIQKGVLDDDGRYRKFVYEYNYFLDKLNKSGTVFYNDPISNYLNELKDEILEGHAKKSAIQVYVTYSSELNAFTNDFGNIYVNIATVAKMNTEAELSLILAHEIAHILLEHSYRTANLDMHLEEGQNAKTISRNDELAYHQFSRENELEADSLAIKLLLNSNMEIPDVSEAFKKLKFAGNTVYDSKIDLSLLFFENSSSMTYFEKVYNPSEQADILFVPDTSVVEDLEIKYSTHPTIEKRIEQLNSILPKTDSTQIDMNRGVNRKFESIKNLSIILYARRLMDEGSLAEALYTVVKARELNPDSDELAKIQLKTLLLLTQDKYRPNFINAVVNKHGPECTNQNFLKFKQSLLRIPALEMNIILENVLKSSRAYFLKNFPYIKRLERFSDQFLYRNNPFLFSVENKSFSLNAGEYIATERVKNLKVFYSEEDFQEIIELTELGYVFNHIVTPNSSFVLEFIENFEENKRLNDNIKLYKEQRNGFEKTLTLDQFIVSFDYKKAYKQYKKGLSISNNQIPPSASIALVQSDTYFLSQKDGQTSLDVERTVKFDEIISDILNEERLFKSFYTNRYSDVEITVADNYSHYVLNKFIEDCWNLTDLTYSSVDEEVQLLAREQKVDYLAYNMNFFIGEASKKRRHGLFYSLYFDVETMGVVYISKIASKQVPSKKLLRHFLFSSYSRNLN